MADGNEKDNTSDDSEHTYIPTGTYTRIYPGKTRLVHRCQFHCFPHGVSIVPDEQGPIFWHQPANVGALRVREGQRSPVSGLPLSVRCHVSTRRLLVLLRMIRSVNA